VRYCLHASVAGGKPVIHLQGVAQTTLSKGGFDLKSKGHRMFFREHSVSFFIFDSYFSAKEELHRAASQTNRTSNLSALWF